jgi:peptidoglycan/LPS O-acetylase OafA/YrhL
MPHLPGLDGLRALAVTAVLLYHADASWLPAGFLGVDVFFVISGYLITSLLLAEWHERKTIDLKAFWLRRARRLLPAAFLTIIASLAYAVLCRPDELVELRGNALAAFAYVTNWYLVLHHVSYFESINRPPLLQHLWSLAVEEQFYLLWPVALVLVLRRWRPNRVVLGVLAGIGVSAALMALLYQPDVDPSRLYYGTDTRAAAPLVGAALAFVWTPWQHPDRPKLARTIALDLTGLTALGALAYLCYGLDEYVPFLYQGGFAVVAMITAVLIAATVHPRARLVPSALSVPPVRWLGLRSYSVYLWHWPILMITQPRLDVPFDGPTLLAFRLVAILAVAELSYRFVEKPVREGALIRAWQAWRQAHGTRRLVLTGGWGLACGTLCAFAVSVAFAGPVPPPIYLPADGIPPAYATSADSPPKPRRATSVPATTALPTRPPAAATTSPSGAHSYTAVGDSVMLGATAALRQTFGNIVVDAAVGRQVPTAIAVLRRRRAAGTLGDVVIVHMGNNGTFTARRFDEMMSVLRGVRKVVFLTDRVPRDWEEPNDAVIAQGVARYPNAILVDWRAATAGRSDLFWNDGIHLRPGGARFYARLIQTALGSS